MKSSDIFDYIMKSFNERHVEYVILHSYENYPYTFESDIDIAIKTNTIKEAINLLDNILSTTDWQVVQYWRHEFWAADCIISNGKEFLQVDFCIHYERNGRILIDIEDLIAKRRYIKNFYVPTYSMEFAYILLKKILKKEFKSGSKERLFNLIQNMSMEQKKETIMLLSKYFGMQDAETIFQLCAENKVDSINIEQAFQTILKKTFHVIKNVEYQIFDLFRKVSRMINPTGLFVVVLGVDGSGKSTISGLFAQKYQNAFRKISHYHSRVRVLNDLNRIKKKEHKDVSKPHEHKKEANKIVSAIKLCYYMTDYLIGNLIFTKAKMKSSLVIVERYFYDYYIDMKRYNLNLSSRFISFFEMFVKKPDVIFVFTGEPEALYERKRELSVEEIRQQNEKLRKRFDNCNTAFFIDTTKNDVNGCVEAMIRSCNDILRNRFQKSK